MRSLYTFLILFVKWRHCKIFGDWFRNHTTFDAASLRKDGSNLWIRSAACTSCDIVVCISYSIVIGNVQSTLTFLFIDHTLEVFIIFLTSTAAHPILLCEKLKPHVTLINQASFFILVHHNNGWGWSLLHLLCNVNATKKWSLMLVMWDNSLSYQHYASRCRRVHFWMLLLLLINILAH